jgi:hypothetical protein
MAKSGKLGLSVLLSLVLSAAVAGPKASQSDITIETVQVTATREQLREAIVTFVSNVTRRDGEHVARWNSPICPSVSGATPTFGQLADYIAMISLARIDLDADFGDAGSILRVFAKNAEGAPKRLTNWDHAFLKALYRPDRASLRPRTDIMLTMREELAP